MHRSLRLVAALALVAAGAIHLQLWFDHFGTHTIAIAFLAQAIACGAAAFVLMTVDGVIADLAAALVAAGSLAGFVASRLNIGLLGFKERGLTPSPQALLALLVEGLALALLLVTASARLRSRAAHA